ncbi:MAG: lysoplasmalogenase [Chitinophagaceae bacterium]|nr:lysoplasmalogenase [Chitinophagaceae bacterium]
MLRVAHKKLSIVFWSLAFLDIISILAGLTIPHYILKSLLLPALMLLLRTADDQAGYRYLLAGLVFSWMGDVLLLFDGRHELFFILGLASFLITHIFYTLFFLRKRTGGRSMLLRQPYWLLLVPGYGFALVWLLFPYLKDMKIPVLAYAVVISTMLLCSIHAFSTKNRRSGFYYVFGALSFVASDSLLALNKFYHPFAYAGTAIMFTYCLAQFLIVWGFLSERKSI